MPKESRKQRQAAEDTDLPSTLQRSAEEAQETWLKAHDSAVESYGEGRRAHMTAYAALKHSWKKEGDRWVRKDKKGPSDPRAARSPSRGEQGGETYGGVDLLGQSKKELYEQARQLEVPGRSKMSKEELAEAVAKKSS